MMKNGHPPSVEQDIKLQFQACEMLLHMQPHDALGAAASFFLYAAEAHPEMLRRVLAEKVVKEGFVGVSLLEHLNRVGR